MRCLNLVFVTQGGSFHSFDQECSTTSQIHPAILRSLPNAYPKQTRLHLFSKILLAERSSVFTNFRSHSFHSYQSINMHLSFAILSILAAPFVAAQSLSSIPSCAVSYIAHITTNHPMLIHCLQLPAAKAGIQKTGCGINATCICSATTFLETVKQQISSICSAADQESKREQSTSSPLLFSRNRLKTNALFPH